VDSLFHLCERGDHHDHINDDVMAVGTTKVDDDPMALYLGYYDLGLSHRSLVSDLWIAPFEIILYMMCGFECMYVGVYALNPNVLLTYKFIMNKVVIH
jgi:hypothetical protein